MITEKFVYTTTIIGLTAISNDIIHLFDVHSYFLEYSFRGALFTATQEATPQHKQNTYLPMSCGEETYKLTMCTACANVEKGRSASETIHISVGDIAFVNPN